MDAQTQQFKVGDIQCIALNDGTFEYPTEWIFSNAPRDEVESSLRDHDLPVNQVVTPYTCLVVKTGEHTVLVDTGADGLAPTTGGLQDRLKQENIAPEDITLVILTHGHPDHIGGVLDATGKPAFPNARYVMSKTEWDFWTSRPDLRAWALDEHVKQMLLSAAEKNLLPLKSVIELVEGEKEVVVGVSIIPTPGHTPGHVGVVVYSANRRLMHMVDSVLHPVLLEHPAWRTVFDLDPDTAAATRQRLLDRAAVDKADVLAYHFPFPGLGHVVKQGSAWKWEPSNNAESTPE